MATEITYNCEFEPGVQPGVVGTFYYFGPPDGSTLELEDLALRELASDYPSAGFRSGAADDGSVRVVVYA